MKNIKLLFMLICLRVLASVDGTTLISSQTVIDAIEEFKNHEEYFEVAHSDYWNNPEVNKIIGSFNTFSKYYLPNKQSNISKECEDDLHRIRNAFLHPGTLLRDNRWALKLVDSWGKEEDGLLSGNRRAIGFFQECLHVEHPAVKYFGRYCLMKIKNTPVDGPEPTLKVSIPTSIKLPAPTLAAYSMYATCIPSSCSELELEESVTKALVESGLSKEATAQCQSLADPKVLDASEIFGIVFFSIICALLLGASVLGLLLDTTRFKHLRSQRIEYLLSFSVPHNMNQIFQVNTAPSKNIISCVHGIRFLSIAMVIFGHQYYYSAFASCNMYSAWHLKKFSGFLFQIIMNADKVVDTFFCLSGLFVALSFFRTMDKCKKFPVVGYYVHRLIRLAPPIGIYLCFLATLSGLFVVGPSAVKYNEYIVGGCRANWWVDLSFVTNFLFRFASSVFHDPSVKITCIPQSWFIAVDFQIYVFMPLILLPVYYWKKKGLAIFGFCTALSFIVPAVIIGVSGTYPTTTTSFNVEKSIQFYYLLYMMPYCRASPYLVGMWVGYILWKTEMKKVQLSTLQVFAGWTLAAVAGFIVLFAYYPFNHLELHPREMGTAASVIYGGLQRGVWGICIGWLVLACHWGYGGMVNSFLSHPGFQPLSRLSYTMFLVSLPLQFAILNSTMRFPYYDHFLKIIEGVGVIFVTGIGALILSLISEQPIVRIEKLLRAKPPKLPEV